MINKMEVFCTMPEGVIIKKVAIAEDTKQIVACTNKGVWLISKDGNPKQVIDGPLPKGAIFNFSGMEFNQGDIWHTPEGCNCMWQEDI